MKKQIFYGSGTAIVTPFNESGKIDYEVFAQLIEMQISGGTAALIVHGTTGESPTLSSEEKAELVRFAVQQCAGRIPVIAGTGTNDTAHAVELSLAAQEAGADGLLLVTPYYNKATQKGLVAHFKSIAGAVNLPVILYNVPSRTGVNISVESYVELSKIENIVATKEASGDISHIAQVVAAVGKELAVYSGNDDQTLPIMALGGIGVISVLSNIAPSMVASLCGYCLKGDYKKAAAIQLENLALANQLFAEVNPIPVKAALNAMGYAVGCGRMPLSPPEDAQTEKLILLMKDSKLL